MHAGKRMAAEARAPPRPGPPVALVAAPADPHAAAAGRLFGPAEAFLRRLRSSDADAAAFAPAAPSPSLSLSLPLVGGGSAAVAAPFFVVFDVSAQGGSLLLGALDGSRRWLECAAAAFDAAEVNLFVGQLVRVAPPARGGQQLLLRSALRDLRAATRALVAASRRALSAQIVSVAVLYVSYVTDAALRDAAAVAERTRCDALLLLSDLARGAVSSAALQRAREARVFAVFQRAARLAVAGETLPLVWLPKALPFAQLDKFAFRAVTQGTFLPGFYLSAAADGVAPAQLASFDWRPATDAGVVVPGVEDSVATASQLTCVRSSGRSLITLRLADPGPLWSRVTVSRIPAAPQ